jgi:polyhydroxyalkanoate synthesis regulator phasin
MDFNDLNRRSFAMTDTVHLVKRYANGRLYDATDKKYITMKELGEFANAGIAFSVVVSKTDEDITETVIAKLKGSESAEKIKKGKSNRKAGAKTKTKPKKTEKKKVDADIDADEPSNIIARLLQMSGSAFTDLPRKSAGLWQSAMTMAEGEFDKRVKQLVKGKEMSESEALRLKDEILGFTKNLKSWLGDNVEDRIADVLSVMKLATRDQLEELSERIEELNNKLDALERMESEREDSPEGVVTEKNSEL